MYRDHKNRASGPAVVKGGFVWGTAVWICLGVSSVHAAGSPAPSEPLVTPPVSSTPLRAVPVIPDDLQRPPLNSSTVQGLDTDDVNIAQELEALKGMADADPDRSASQAPSGLPDPGHAAWTLGLIYLHGAGVPQDFATAQTWFERALQLGARHALAGLAWCAIEGCRTPAHPARADRWITPLKRVDRARALYLEWLAQDRLAPLRTATPERAEQEGPPPLRGRPLLVAAARGGDIHALIELGMDAVARRQPAQAIRYFKTAAPRSHIAASNAAIVAESLQAQKPRQADENRLAEELYTEAQRHHRGEGRPVNYVEAIRLYRLAADKGSAEAQRMLALIYSRPLVKGSFDVTWISQLGELDLTRSTPGLRIKTAPRQLQRERTALIDFLPEKWRARIL